MTPARGWEHMYSRHRGSAKEKPAEWRKNVHIIDIPIYETDSSNGNDVTLEGRRERRMLIVMLDT
jgi:hypothetical protein